ncbi:hypothetical protein CERZMDRAFT_97372 [Cercospora zeae-maydis SCOH1-5]|uniref:Uncharacterized protein n=1 Tax=Cercospora zeae-maydis SCOH1-5 TaxID=717836 RepID=A0A6A6FHD5_9PEZI|nr:hypothetical protein CERZMDRAFT_97372 [Cercospora zeae-maydis SCOH1-5]
MAAPTGGARARVTSHKNHHQTTRDLFMDMPYDDAVKRTTTPIPLSPSEQHEQRHSLFTDLVLTPLNVISFMISLLFIAERHYGGWWASWRSGPNQEVTAGSTGHPRWSWRRRRVAKMRMDEAWEMRDRVVLNIVLWAVLGLVACVYSARRLYSWAGTS